MVYIILLYDYYTIVKNFWFSVFGFVVFFWSFGVNNMKKEALG